MIKLFVEIEISEEAYELLKKINLSAAEYRDTGYPTAEQFEKSTLFKDRGQEKALEVYMDRNCGGTYHLIPELEKYGLVEMDTMCWHQTYEITELGKKLLDL
jgi:hypothetical protein